MIEDVDLVVGTRLLCVECGGHGENRVFTVGHIYSVVERRKNAPSGKWPYSITCDGGDVMVMNLHELNGIDNSYGRVKCILESSLTGKEIFTFRLSGKLPERFYE